MGERHGVLLMAYGSPQGPQDLEAYYTDIRGGRRPTDEQLGDLRRRYEAIGGMSPLAAHTRAQAAGLARELDRRAPGHYRVELGLKHASPTVEAGARTLRAAGITEATFLVLAPHYSALSVGQYLQRATQAFDFDGQAVGCRSPTAWFDEPALIELLADRIRAALGRLPPGSRTEVLVTAHSLPERALVLDEPTYPEQLRRTGELLAEAADLPSWRIAWQSAGRTSEPWIGPDVGAVIRGLPAEGYDSVVVCPAGFTSDHLEVLYDIDIEARAVAEAAGLRLERTASLNDDPRLLGLLADLVVEDRPGHR